jgi:hypothetical protein
LLEDEEYEDGGNKNRSLPEQIHDFADVGFESQKLDIGGFDLIKVSSMIRGTMLKKHH